MTLPELITLAFAISLMCSALIFFSKPFHIRFTAKGHGRSAVQSAHKNPTPRIGGLAILAGFAITSCFFDAAMTQTALFLQVAMLPVFIGGIGEDTGFNVSPVLRLVFSFISALVAGLLLDQWVSRIGIPGLDLIVATTITAAIVTIVIAGGFSHAFNLIDGINGLAIGVAIMMATSLAVIGYLKGDHLVLSFASVLAASCLGLFLFNFPFGKLFLGDAGAYSIGHLLMWVAVMLINRHADIAPFALLLIFFWPIADMLLSIYRRYNAGKPISAPDRLHFHQLVMRGLEITILGRHRRHLANPLATLIILPLASIPMILGVLSYNSDKRAAVAFVLAILIFVLTYRFGGWMAKRYASTAGK